MLFWGIVAVINFCVSLICLEVNSSTSCAFQPNYLEFDHFTLMHLSRGEGSFSVKACNKNWELGSTDMCFGQEDNYLVSVFFCL